jgi:hypothetical protein
MAAVCVSIAELSERGCNSGSSSAGHRWTLVAAGGLCSGNPGTLQSTSPYLLGALLLVQILAAGWPKARALQDCFRAVVSNFQLRRCIRIQQLGLQHEV